MRPMGHDCPTSTRGRGAPMAPSGAADAASGRVPESQFGARRARSRRSEHSKMHMIKYARRPRILYQLPALHTERRLCRVERAEKGTRNCGSPGMSEASVVR